MFGMIGVMFESGPVGKMGDEARVERAVEMQNICPDIKAIDVFDQERQTTELYSVIFACLFVNIGIIFPANDMDKHRAIFARMA